MPQTDGVLNEKGSKCKTGGGRQVKEQKASIINKSDIQ